MPPSTGCCGCSPARHGRVFAVGDDCQSIYGWRGAEVAHIRRFGAGFSGGRRPIKLETNYRSTRTILAAANADCGEGPGSAAQDAAFRRRRGRRPAPPSCCAAWRRRRRRGGPSSPGCRICSTRRLSLPLRACAVLVRAGFVAEPILEALREAGLPVQMVSEREAELPREVLGVIAWLRLALSRAAQGGTRGAMGRGGG